MNVVKSFLKVILPSRLMDEYRKIWTHYSYWKRWIKNQLIQIKYFGDEVECPFCKKSFSRFMPTGVLERPFWSSTEGLKLLKDPLINVANAQCPKCGCGERQRLLYFYLLQELDFFKIKSIKVLDVAPDDFLYNKVFSKMNIDYISIDIKNSRRPSQIMDVTKLTFEDNIFDSIICNHVLEHIPEDTKAMEELYRVLKPGGWAILQVPIWAFKTVEKSGVTSSEEYLKHYGHSDHVRRYGFDYVDRLIKSGFVVNVDNFSRKLKDEFRYRYGLFETEDIFFCRKD